MNRLFSFAFCVVSVVAGDFFSSVVIPSDISITVDETVYIRIKSPIDGNAKCEYQAPGKKDRNSLDFFVKFTDDGTCGIKIEKVQKSHEGVWKLISTFKNASFEKVTRGASIVKVKDRLVVSHDKSRIFGPKDSFAPPNVDLNYCYVSKHDSIPMKITEIDTKKCTIPESVDQNKNDYVNGLWTVRLGIKGVTNEISYTVNVQSTDEAIETVVKRIDNDKAQLLCRVKNLKNLLTFCRFERIDDDGFGLNLENGIASGNYRYFGQGFEKGECGLEISNLNMIDKTQWNCFIGLMDAEDAMNDKIAMKDKKIYKLSSIVDASDDWDKVKIISTETEIFLVDNQTAIIQCNSNNPIDRCWFQHPIHRILSVSDKKPITEEDDYHYFGESFQLGHCGIKIKSFYFADAGEWKCGVGQSVSMNEDVKTIKVDVKASFMLSITKQIEDFSRNSVVLQCRGIPYGGLASCHFFSPSGEAFTISEKITRFNPIKGNYYFDPNRKLSDGFCTVVIKELKREHAGKWICSGRLFGHDEESQDSIYVTVDGIRGASVSLLNVAVTLPIVMLLTFMIVGLAVYRRLQQRRMAHRDTLDAVSMSTVGSNDSGDSRSGMRSSRVTENAP